MISLLELNQAIEDAKQYIGKKVKIDGDLIYVDDIVLDFSGDTFLDRSRTREGESIICNIATSVSTNIIILGRECGASGRVTKQRKRWPYVKIEQEQ